MRFTQYLVVGILFFVAQVNAQEKTITGIVIDAETKLTLPFCNVLLLNSTTGTTTNDEGKFELSIPENLKKPKLLVSYMGYESATILLNEATRNYNILLKSTTSDLNEVVITGSTRATLIRKNPVAIVNVSKKEIEETSASNIIDVLVKNVPGLNAVKTGANISKPFIRGLGYNRVLTLYDGMRQEGQQWGDEHGIEVDAYNIEKAEVIKGPSSLLYGSDALAGVVSMFPFIPKRKDGKIHGKYLSEYQTNNNLIGNGFHVSYRNQHFITALRGSLRVAKNYRNSIDGRVYNTNFNEKNVSALLGYTSNKGYSHLNFTLYDNLQGIPDGSRDSLTRKFTKQIYEGDLDNIKNRPLVSNTELNSYKLSPLHQRIQHYRVYTNNFYKVGKGDIDFKLGFQQNIRREYNHPTIPKQAGMYVRLNTVNYGLRYNAPKFANIESTVGFNGMFQNNKSINATDFPIPDYNLGGGGIYIYEKWKHSRWNVSGGVRYDIRQIKWNDFYLKTNPETGFDEHVKSPNTSSATLQFPAYKKIFRGLSASLGFTYQVTRQISVKANIARGYRAPNITEIASNGLDPGAHIIYLGNKNFNPEFSLQQDIGASARFKNVSADISVFNNNIKNYIYLDLLVDAQGNIITDSQGNRTYKYKQASAQLYGAEFSFSIHPQKMKGFNFNNSLSTVYGFNRSAEYKGKGKNGEYLPFIPPLKLLSSISQKIKTHSTTLTSFTPKMELAFSAAQNRFLGLNKTETRTPSFALLNTGVHTAIKYSKNRKVQVQFQVNNLLDKAYQSNLSRLKYFEYYQKSSNGNSGIYSMGRNICLKVIFPF